MRASRHFRQHGCRRRRGERELAPYSDSGRIPSLGSTSSVMERHFRLAGTPSAPVELNEICTAEQA